ncbi:MAG TPA: response regulator transcription factor [Acetobacteraceae bacterium]|nr:response regulator transcription factor [Acetobacteraceae bacterium]
MASAHPDWDVAESDTLEEHRSRLRSRSIDLLILEARLLGAELAKSIPGHGRVSLAAAVIAVTEPGDSVGALGCLSAGAHATISRSDATSRMLATIKTVMNRRHQPVVSAVTTPSPESSEVLNLTNRQLDVLRLLAKGQSNKVIARDLGLSVSTVKVHLNTVFRALGASNRVEAVVRARPFDARVLVSQGH